MVSDNQFSVKGFLIWGICALFFLYDFFLRTVIGAYQHPLMLDLQLTSFKFSLLSTTIFLLIYGLMQLPAGIIVDKIGLKKSLLIGTFCCTVATFGFSYAHSYPVAVFFRVLMGFGASFGFVCLLISVYEWMPHRNSALFIGLSQFIGTMGPVIAAGPLESVIDSSGIHWRTLFICLGIIGMVITAIIFFFVQSNQRKAGRFSILNRPETVSASISRLFARLQPWHIALLCALLYFPVEYLSENEGRAFLVLKGISLNSASYMLTISWIGYAIGCPLLGFISDFFERRKIIMQASGLIGLLAILTILYVTDKLALQGAFFLLGISASGQSIGYAVMAEQFKKQYIAIGFGLNNAMITILAAINAPVFGLLLDQARTGDSLMLSDYLWVFNLLIVIVVGAIFLATFTLKETFCKSCVDYTILGPITAHKSTTE